MTGGLTLHEAFSLKEAFSALRPTQNPVKLIRRPRIVRETPAVTLSFCYSARYPLFTASSMRFVANSQSDDEPSFISLVRSLTIELWTL